MQRVPARPMWCRACLKARTTSSGSELRTDLDLVHSPSPLNPPGPETPSVRADLLFQSHMLHTDSQNLTGIALMLIIFLLLLLRPTWPPHQAEGQPSDKDHCHFELGASQKQWRLTSDALHHRAFELGHQWQGEGDLEAVQQERCGGAHLCGGGSEGSYSKCINSR